jgi:hypothetical protein
VGAVREDDIRVMPATPRAIRGRSRAPSFAVARSLMALWRVQMMGLVAAALSEATRIDAMLGSSSGRLRAAVTRGLASV